MTTIGEKLSPILVEIENTLWEFDANVGIPPKYTTEGFRAAVKIFSSALMDKIWELQGGENMDMEDRGNMAFKAGCATRDLVKTYTDIDTHDLYNE